MTNRQVANAGVCICDVTLCDIMDLCCCFCMYCVVIEQTDRQTDRQESDM